ncbi:ATP-binding protein [Mycoplasma zalophi]|uniref:ATP-binding protein n=1 Tax=Mycoplasma zalophi TaxID=191287 RepID=UPI0021C72954|nr:ATP-binding protein [Mycoplasma zalophi]MCU4117241.1 ATP-binding protein [Mycoplasma zalophi]
MKIASIKLKNFRGYSNEVEFNLNDITAIIGKNDTGKSTILEALDIFFNDGKGLIKLDKNDINKSEYKKNNNEISITVCFKDLPKNITIDSSFVTKLEDEYLLNSNGQLEIIKKYSNASSNKTYIKAKHPQNPKCNNLFYKKNQDLKKIITDEDIKCNNLAINSSLRKAIWNYYKNELDLKECEIDLSKEETKKIWESLQKFLPVFSLFQSDRKNSDADSEVQDPLKEAIKQIFKDENIQNKLSEISKLVKTKISEVAERTLQKIKEMDLELANSLNPNIPESKDLKWQDVFKNVSITGDEDIPINKRGSGVRRLILLNFFRAEAERRRENRENTNIIYAIEEPETSQHTSNQIKLIDSLKELSKSTKTQILLTTHSPNIVKQIGIKNLRLVSENNGVKVVNTVKPIVLNSLNEVNYLAFGEISEEYHNELYGYIESDNLLNKFEEHKTLREYKKLKNNSIKFEKVTLSKYIRHQIHHPENKLNTRFTKCELKNSIEMMINFLKENSDKSNISKNQKDS